MRIIKLLIMSLLLIGVTFAKNAEEQKKFYKATINKDGIQRVEIVGGEYFYDPNYIIVKKDIPVELMVRKKPGIVPHNIVINEPEAGINIKESLSSKQKAIKFTPKKVGKYPFYCDKKLLFFKSHREKGMEGIIEVME